MSDRAKKSAIVAKVYQEWAAEQVAASDPTAPRVYVQDAEGEELMNASTAAHDDLVRRTDAALAAAGLS